MQCAGGGKSAIRGRRSRVEPLGSGAADCRRQPQRGGTACLEASAVNQASGMRRGRSRECVTQRAPLLPGGSGVNRASMVDGRRSKVEGRRKWQSERLLGSNRTAYWNVKAGFPGLAKQRIHLPDRSGNCPLKDQCVGGQG